MSSTTDEFLASLDDFASPSLDVPAERSYKRPPPRSREEGAATAKYHNGVDGAASTPDVEVIDVDEDDVISDSDDSSMRFELPCEVQSRETRLSRLKSGLEACLKALKSCRQGAQVPPSMADAKLELYQRQALHWMQKREEDGNAICDYDNENLSVLDQKAAEESREPPPMGVARGGILADPARSGRKRTMIALCESKRTQRSDTVHYSRVVSAATLIVCRAAAVKSWITEIRLSVHPRPRVLVYSAHTTRRLFLFNLAEDYDYVIVTYQSLRREINAKTSQVGNLHLIRWSRLVVDEAQTLLSVTTQRSRACFELSAECRWVITPSLFQSRLEDLFVYLRFLRVPVIGSMRWWNLYNSDFLSGTFQAMLKHVFSTMVLMRKWTTLFSKVNSEVIYVQQTDEEKRQYEKLRIMAERTLSTALTNKTRSLTNSANEVINLCQSGCLSTVVASEVENEHVVEDHATRELNMETFASELRNFCGQKQAEAYVKEVLNSIRDHELETMTCPICFDIIIRPTLLPCAHLFCKSCVHSSLSNKTECPSCRMKVSSKVTPMEVPEILVKTFLADPDLLESFDRWPPSSKMRALLSILTKIPPKEKVVVFCHSVRYLRYVQWTLLQSGIKSELLVFRTSLQDTNKVLSQFHDNTTATDGEERSRVLLVQLTPRTASIDASFASHAFFMGVNLFPTLDRIAISSLLLPGKSEVKIVRLLADETLEGVVETLAQKKQKTPEFLFNLNPSISLISKEEVLQLFPELNVYSQGDPTGRDNALLTEDNDSSEEDTDSDSDSDTSLVHIL